MKRTQRLIFGYERLSKKIADARASSDESEKIRAAQSMLRRSLNNNLETGIVSHNDGDGLGCAWILTNAYKKSGKKRYIADYFFPPEGKKIPREMCNGIRELGIESLIFTDLPRGQQLDNRTNNVRQALKQKRGYGVDVLIIDHHHGEEFMKFPIGDGDWDIKKYNGGAYVPGATLVDFLDKDINPHYGLLLEVKTNDRAAVIPTWEICKDFVNKKESLPWAALGVLCDRAHDTQKGVDLINYALKHSNVTADGLRKLVDVLDLVAYVRKESAHEINNTLLSLDSPQELIGSRSRGAREIMKDYKELAKERSRLIADYSDTREEVASRSFYYEVNSKYNIGVPVINKLADISPHDMIFLYYPRRKRCYFRKGENMSVVLEAIGYCMYRAK
jgi:hypothetical protein